MTKTVPLCARYFVMQIVSYDIVVQDGVQSTIPIQIVVLEYFNHFICDFILV